MSNKKLILNESGMRQYDSGIIKGTRVIARIPGTDRVLWETENKVLAAGSAYNASLHFDFGQNKIPAPVTPSYNTALGIENSVSDLTPPETPQKIYLFCMGTDGCGETSSQQYEVDYTKWLKPADMIPFRYTASELSFEESKQYFGSVKELDNFGNPTGYKSYYFKSFETDPLYKQVRIDGTPVDSGLYDDTLNKVPLQTYVELKLMIYPTDAREWFAAKDIRNGYVNTISLLQGWYKEIGGIRYYQNVHPVTKLNFPTEYLIDPTKGLDITYDIFY